jgi:hypothetical protein
MPAWELDNLLKDLGEFIKNDKSNQSCPLVGGSEKKK